MKSTIFLFAILSLYYCYAAPQEETYANSCYVCDPKDKECQDPFNVETGSKSICQQINSRTINKQIVNVTLDSDQMARQNSDDSPKYKCVKLIRKIDNETLVERGCYLVEETVKTPCEYLKESEGNILNCKICGSDNCNGATSLTITSFVGIVSFMALYINRLV